MCDQELPEEVGPVASEDLTSWHAMMRDLRRIVVYHPQVVKEDFAVPGCLRSARSSLLQALRAVQMSAKFILEVLRRPEWDLPSHAPTLAIVCDHAPRLKSCCDAYSAAYISAEAMLLRFDLSASDIESVAGIETGFEARFASFSPLADDLTPLHDLSSVVQPDAGTTAGDRLYVTELHSQVLALTDELLGRYDTPH